MGARNREGIGLSYQTARLHRGWRAGMKTRFLAPLDCSKIPAYVQCTLYIVRICRTSFREN
jgi:hypothetical protein